MKAENQTALTHLSFSPHKANLFRNASFPDSQVSRFKNIKPPTISSSAPLKYLHGVKVPAEFLVKLQEAADQRGR